MAIKTCCVAFLVMCGAGSFAAKLPPGMHRCDRKQADFGDCITKALQDAVVLAKDSMPQVGLPRIEPLDVPALTISAGTGAAVSVEQQYKNVKVSGFTDVKVKNVQFDFENKKVKISGVFNQILMKADYAMNGKVLLLPIKGNGASILAMDKVQGDLAFDFEIIEKKGKKFFNITGNQLSLSPTLVSYKFENLFNGDKALGDNINKVLNDNWKEVFVDAKGGFEKAYGLIFQGLAQSLFSRVAIRDIFLNETEL